MQEPQIKEFENLNRDLELLNQNNEDFKEQKQTKLKAQPSTEKDSTSESELSDKQNSEETKTKNGASQLYILQDKDLSQNKLDEEQKQKLSNLEKELQLQLMINQKEANTKLQTQLTAAKENEIQINIKTMELTKNLEELQNKFSKLQNELAKKENENQSLIKQQQDHSSQLVLLNQKLEQEQQQTIQLQKNFDHKEKQLKAENQELINKLSQIEYGKLDNQKIKLKKQAKDLNETL